jgi:hypothetical protein
MDFTQCIYTNSSGNMTTSKEKKGSELFRMISSRIMMNMTSRGMVLRLLSRSKKKEEMILKIMINSLIID